MTKSSSSTILFNGYIDSVLNITALRNYDTHRLAFGATIIVDAENTFGDNNGGIYAYNPNDTTTVDDGYRNIKPVSGAGIWTMVAGRGLDAATMLYEEGIIDAPTEAALQAYYISLLQPSVDAAAASATAAGVSETNAAASAAAANDSAVASDASADAAASSAQTALNAEANVQSVSLAKDVYTSDYATSLPQGVLLLGSGGIGTGTGGTPGTYNGGVSGGPAGFAWTYTIDGTGKIASYAITYSGLSTSSAAPTLSYPNGGITGATVPTTVVGSIIAVNAGYWTTTADSQHLVRWYRQSGAASPQALLNADGSQVEVDQSYANSVGALNAFLANGSNFNRYPDPEWEYLTLGGDAGWTTAMPVVNSKGARAITTPSSATAIDVQDQNRDMPVALFPNGVFSASIIIRRKDATSTPDALQVRVFAFDSSSHQLGGWTSVGSDNPAFTSSYSRYTPTNAITTPTELVIASGVPFPAGTAFLRLEVRVATTSTMDISHVCFRNGTNPHFAPVEISPKGIADLKTAIAGVAPEDFADITALFPNCFLTAEVDVQSMRYGTPSANLLTATTYGADSRPCWSLVNPANNPTITTGSFTGNIPANQLNNGTGLFSAAIHIYDVDDASSDATSAQYRVLIIQRDSNNIEIMSARTSLLPTVPGRPGLHTPTWFRLSGITLDPACSHVLMYVEVASNGSATRTIRFGDMLLAPGLNATYRRPSGSSGSSTSVGAVAYVSPTGNDGANGTQGSPLATGQAAVTKIGGNGTVIYLPGSYTNGNQTIDPTTIPPGSKVTLRGTRASSTSGYDTYPVIYMASKITGISKTAGQSKVYQATVPSLPTNASFNWIYQDGVADPRTLIGATERSPQHRGRTNRLMHMAKLVKTTATTLAGAKAEIDAASNNDPRAFIDDSTSTLYFSIVGGGDGTAANIYIDSATGLFNGAGVNLSCGEIVMNNLEVRYGGVNLRGFQRSHLDEVFVFGSRVNAVDYMMTSYGTLECACSGSINLNGDGLNGHNGAKIVGYGDYYGHDCWDDGWSDHEGCSSRLLGGGLVEYNGGTGLAPAYGDDHISINFVARNNTQRAGFKKANFYATGAPSGSGEPDDGIDTRALFMNCVSIGGNIGFADDGNSLACYAATINCKAYDQTGPYGYDVSEMKDCGWSSSTGVARNTGRSNNPTVVKNTTLVV